jgi:hypothetical protein
MPVLTGAAIKLAKTGRSGSKSPAGPLPFFLSSIRTLRKDFFHTLLPIHIFFQPI